MLKGDTSLTSKGLTLLGDSGFETVWPFNAARPSLTLPALPRAGAWRALQPGTDGRA